MDFVTSQPSSELRTSGGSLRRYKPQPQPLCLWRRKSQNDHAEYSAIVYFWATTWGSWSKKSYTFHILIKDFGKSIVIFPITDTVDDHFCGYLWHLLAVCLYAWQRACWLCSVIALLLNPADAPSIAVKLRELALLGENFSVSRATFHSAPWKKRMYICWNICTLHLNACHVRVTIGDCCCCCICVTYFER